VQIEMIKGHGSGNDFLMIDEIANNYSFSETDRASLARLLCNRETNLGADGILFIMGSDHVDGRMRVFNADGSEASMCGNGLRLVARYMCERLQLKEAVIETMKADLRVSEQTAIYPNVTTYQVEISPVSFQVKDLPLKINQPTVKNEEIVELSDELLFTAVAVPNPHLITIVEKAQLETDLQLRLSEKVNGTNDLFPDGVNVSFVQTLDPGNIYVRTFERGVGFTNACGTAMSASSLVTCLNKVNDVEKVINVYNDGGKVQCIVHNHADQYSMDLIGNATYVYKVTVTVDLEGGLFTLSPKTIFSEQQSYEIFQSEIQEFLNSRMKG
jgi:diaminopimelate epimerase